ncbi:MAG: hypothetical protein ABH872_03035 [Candidatus Omnitrophota bacterium]
MFSRALFIRRNKEKNDYFLRSSWTVIELVIVIVVIGIIIAIIAPDFNIVHTIRLQGAHKKLISDIRYAQNIAIAQHTDTRIIFSIIDDTYNAWSYDNSLGAWVSLNDPFLRTQMATDFKTDKQYRGIDIENAWFNGGAILCFNWEGIPQDVGGNNLSAPGLVDLGFMGETLSITLIPQTGVIE